MTDLDERRSGSTPWFLAGNYAPVAEELTAVDLPVTGAIPPSLSGRYLRNGSNPKSGRALHWFFGDGMVHGIRIAGGKAEWYRNRYVQTTKLRTGLEITDPEAMFDPDRQRREHPRARARRSHLGARGGPPPVRAEPRTRHARLRQLRRQAHHRVHRPSEVVPRDRRTALLRLLAGGAVPHLPRTRRVRCPGALGRDHRACRHDDARLHDHSRPCDLHGPAGGVRPVEPPGAAEVGRVVRCPHRHRAPDGHRRRRAVVRDRPVLRVPSTQCVRRR
jgi:hypothetical protein